MADAGAQAAVQRRGRHAGRRVGVEVALAAERVRPSQPGSSERNWSAVPREAAVEGLAVAARAGQHVAERELLEPAGRDGARGDPVGGRRGAVGAVEQLLRAARCSRAAPSDDLALAAGVGGGEALGADPAAVQRAGLLVRRRRGVHVAGEALLRAAPRSPGRATGTCRRPTGTRTAPSGCRPAPAAGSPCRSPARSRADGTPLVTRWSEPLLYLARAGVRRAQVAEPALVGRGPRSPRRPERSGRCPAARSGTAAPTARTAARTRPSRRRPAAWCPRSRRRRRGSSRPRRCGSRRSPSAPARRWSAGTRACARRRSRRPPGSA